MINPPHTEYVILTSDGKFEQSFKTRNDASKYVRFLELTKEVDPHSIQFFIRRKAPGRPTSTQ